MTTNAQERTAPAQAAEQPQEGQETQHWAVWSVYARESARSVPGPEQEQAAVREFEDLVETLGAEGVTVRGAYDVSGQRAELAQAAHVADELGLVGYGRRDDVVEG